MIKATLIALMFMASGQPLTTDMVFNIGYKLGHLTYCKYYEPGTVNAGEAFYMAIDDLTEEERQTLKSMGKLAKNDPLIQANNAGAAKATLLCLRSRGLSNTPIDDN
jgi:hypothetical protein